MRLLHIAALGLSLRVASAVGPCGLELDKPEVEDAKTPAVERQVVLDAMFGSAAQDSHSYFYRALLRDPNRKLKVEALANEAAAAYMQKNPAASPRDVSAFLGSFNRNIALSWSGDAPSARSEKRNIQKLIGEPAAAKLEGDAQSLLGEFVKANHEYNVEIATAFVNELRKAGTPLDTKGLEKAHSELVENLDALSIFDSTAHFQVAASMDGQLDALSKPATDPKKREKQLKVLEYIDDFSRGRGGNAGNVDDSIHAAGLFIAKLEDRPKESETKNWIERKANELSPKGNDRKAYLEFLQARVESLHERGILSKDSKKDLLYSAGKDQDNYMLDVIPHMPRALKNIAEHIAFERLKVILPEVVGTGGFIRIRAEIVDHIIYQHFVNGNSRSSVYGRQFREFDAEAISRLDADLRQYYQK